MINGKQAQSTSDNSTAIQSGRDVHYSSGITPGQMIEILQSIEGLVQVYTSQSKDVMEQRLQSFRNDVIKEFSESGNGNPKAFSDPDFQGSLLDAQKAVARSGDEDLSSVLIDLVSQRSKCERRDRLSLTLNDAIAKAGSLTSEDFDLLALIFVFKNMQISNVANLQALGENLNKFFDPFVSTATEGELSLSYLESHGCLRTSVGGMITFNSAYEIICERHPGVVTKGVSEEDIKSVFPESSPIWNDNSDLIKPSPLDNDLLIVVPGDAALIDACFERAGIPDRPGSSYINLVKDKRMGIDDFIKVMKPFYSRLQVLFNKYDNGGARNSNLTALGLALAHARLSKVEGFIAPINIWIK